MLNTWPVNTKPLLESDTLETDGPVIAPAGPVVAWPFEICMPSGGTYQERLQYLTEIQESRNGKEYRASRRTAPRKSLRFGALLANEDVAHWQGFVNASLVRNIVVPNVYQSVALPAEIPAGSDAIYLATPPGWMLPGMTVVIGNSQRKEALLIEAVKGELTYFTTETAYTWPSGTTVYSGMTGSIGQSHQAEMIGPDVANVSVDFRVRALSEPTPETTAPAVTFDGREVLLERPTWMRPLSQAFTQTVDELDYEVGPTYRYSPVAFASDVFQLAYVHVGPDEAQTLIDVFHRAKGRRGEIYAPTWMPDLRLRGDQSGTTLRVRGPETQRYYAASLTHQRIFIHLRDGTTLLRQVSSISGINDGQGQDSVLNLSDSLPTIGQSEVVMAGWLLLRRFASDELVIERYPTGATSISLGLKTLEVLAEEP